MARSQCQIQSLPTMSEMPGTWAEPWQKRNRLRRMIKRRIWYLGNFVSELADGKYRALHISQSQSNAQTLQSGDKVRVRSREEIKAMLDKWNQFKRCSFMEEMWAYCGAEHRVYKRVNRFLDERDYLLKKCKGIVILEGVFCEGTKDYGPCDRSCFFFWREEWLEKIGSE